MLLKLPLRETSLVSEPVPRNGKFCGRDRGKKPDQIGRRDRASSNQNEKSPPIPGLSDRALNIRKIADWMVVCAVWYEPVSNDNSLLTGKLTGNFAISGVREPTPRQETPVPQRLIEQFPTQINRENILGNREFSARNREFKAKQAPRCCCSPQK